MNREKLLKLAVHLRTVAPEHFDMSTWGTEGFFSRKDHCGTAACALGHAVLQFPDDLEATSHSHRGANIYCRKTSHEGYRAAAVCFELEFDDACAIFNPAAYDVAGKISPIEVAERIEAMCSTEVDG